MADAQAPATLRDQVEAFFAARGEGPAIAAAAMDSETLIEAARRLRRRYVDMPRCFCPNCAINAGYEIDEALHSLLSMARQFG